jgi:hypothetical protein
MSTAGQRGHNSQVIQSVAPRSPAENTTIGSHNTLRFRLGRAGA